MNPTREKAFNAAMDIARFNYGVNQKSADDLLDMARKFQCYLDGTDHGVESGADAAAVADKAFTDGTKEDSPRPAYLDADKAYAPSPSANGADMALGSGADTAATSADGPQSLEAGATLQGPKSSKPRKPRKLKAANKAKREKKGKAAEVAEVKEVGPAQAEAPVNEPALADAA